MKEAGERVSPTSSALRRIQDWFREQCDGEWEHTYGVRIDTLDNPGWVVEIDLDKTAYEHQKWELLFFDEGEGNWMSCSKDSAMFKGAGDPSKLEVILEYFLTKVSGERKSPAEENG